MDHLRISAIVRSRAKTAPHATAFIQDNRSVSNADFADLVDRAASWLHANGIGRGDAVALWLVNSVEWLALFAALARLRAIAVPINTRYRSEEVRHILAVSEARLLLTHGSYQRQGFLQILGDIAAVDLPRLRGVALVNEPPHADAPACAWPLFHFNPSAAHAPQGADASDALQPVVLFSTSGTTKAPKLVVHPQRTLVDHARRCAAVLGLSEPGAVLLAMLPMCGVFGLNSVLAALAGGAPVIVQAVFDAPAAAQLMMQHNVTHTFGSDEMFRRLDECVEGNAPFPAARFFGFGAFTSSFAELAQRCVGRGMPLHGLYGSSEVLALFSAQPSTLPLAERLLGGGLPMSGTEVSIRVRDTATGELLPAGASGELEICAPNNFIGYFRDPGATRESLSEGHFKTGDLGHLRPDGSFVFESRIGDAMRLGGHLVNPLELEEIMKRMDGVADAHVVASEVGGQPRAVAFVIPVGAPAELADRLIYQLKDRVAGFKVPVRIWTIDAFPETQGANGMKTSRVRLRQMAQERIAAENTAVKELPR